VLPRCTHDDEANYAGNVKKNTAGSEEYEMNDEEQETRLINIGSRITNRMRLLIALLL